MTRVFGLLGHPVAHSLSPRMHAAWIAAAGLDAAYHAFEIAPDTSGEALVQAVRTLGLAGVNLTVPFKERVLSHLDAVDSVAGRIGAVNTVVARDGRLVGTNTDAPGFAAAATEAGARFEGATVLVLGAGGAARAVAVGCADAGAERVILLNRTETRALSVAHALDRECPSTRIEGGPLAAFPSLGAEADVVAVAVSGAGVPAIRALDPAPVRDDAVWIDLNYWDPQPPHLAPLQRRGVRVQDGLPMLIHQGALAFRAFTGVTGDPAVARGVLTGGIGV